MKVLLSGATGFIGSRLAGPLVEAGHDVRAMTRHPDDYDGPGTAVGADAEDEAALADAMEGCEAAYYLVHGMDEGGDFGERDARSAAAFGAAARKVGLRQVIYLGGLGREGDDLSEHLSSRQEVEGRLAQDGVPVTALRAALVIGAGSASFELLRQVVRNLPLLVVPPKASTTKVQPIAIADVVRYLVGVLGNERAINATFDIGGPDVLTYAEMLHRMARRLGKDSRGLRVPVLPSLVAKLGVRLVTDVDPQLAATLLESLGNDVVVSDGHRIAAVLPGPLHTFDEMLDAALEEER